MKRLEYRPVSQINVTSLVDVTLVLLIVFMLTAPLLTEGLDIELPRTETQGLDMSDSFIVTVTEDGEIYLNDRKIPLDALGEIVRSSIIPSGQDVFVRGDQGVAYGTVVKVIGVLRASGVGSVGLVAESEDLD